MKILTPSPPAPQEQPDTRPVDRVLRRPGALTVVYGCGHAAAEYRGHMSDALRAQVLAECRERDCDRCRLSAELAARPAGARQVLWEDED